MTLTVGSLFSGIGGLDLGFERAGMRVRWQVENDPYCQRVLAKHWPDVPRYGDIANVELWGLERVDVVCGGFPCQPVSLAGRRRAQRDKRWLWPHFAHTLRIVRPRYAVVENVPGLASAGMGDVLGDLAALGFDAEWESIPAAAVGAPHLRYRIFLVAYADSTGQPLFPGRATGAELARLRAVGRSGRWDTEPGVGRVDDGSPARVDRVRALGNAVVPQVAQWVGERIVAHAASSQMVDTPPHSV